MKRSKFILFLIPILSVFLAFTALYSADDFVSSRVKDISDRHYEQAVIQLLDNAKEAIVISMYSIRLGTDTKNPVGLLLNDLLEARERGVSVTLYLNTRFYGTEDEESYTKSPVFRELEDNGCVVYFMPSNRRLHDKLIIVDSRYVVEGSANWSISALKSNFESNTLIDSPDLARVKLARLKNLLILSKPKDKGPYAPAYIENLPKTLIIPKDLLLNKKYFPRMVTSSDSRALDLYLLLLAHSQATGKDKFLVGLESMALSLGLPSSWTNNALRRQVIKSLKKLQSRYHLIDVKFFHGRDAEVILTPTPGEAFTISSNPIIQIQNPLTLRLKYLLLIKALLKAEGKDIYSISVSSLSKRFNVSKDTIRDGFRELVVLGE